MHLPRLLSLSTLVILACIVPMAQAGLFSASPVRMYMAPKDRAIAVTISNESDEELFMQADVYAWAQKPDGQDQLTLTEDLILSPPILKLAPRARQVVRLARLGPPPVTGQQTYRLVVREVPEARPGEQRLQLQIALAFSLPVFITAPGARHQLDCTLERVSADTVRAQCENTGNAYTQLRDLTLRGPSGEKLAQRDSGGYILPSIRRGFEIRRAEGAIPAGAARLSMALDDGSLQSFELDVPR